jgi:excisionase family DNA binding protein
MKRVLEMKEMFSTKAAARRVGVCEETMREYVKKGWIEAHRFGPRRIIRISEEAIRAFLMNHRTVNNVSDFKSLAANDGVES